MGASAGRADRLLEAPLLLRFGQHFNQERHLVSREVYKQRRPTALFEWRALMAS